VSASASIDPERKRGVVCLAQRHLSDPVACRVAYAGSVVASASATLLAGDSPSAFNDAAHPTRVEPASAPVEVVDGGARLELPPHSIALVELELR
jgi:alpha-L-arabinofuranosidase